VKIHYDVTIDDMIAWNVYHYGQSPAMRRTRAFNVWCPPIVYMLMAAGLGLLMADEPIAAAVFAFPLVVISVLWVVMMPAYLRRALVRGVRKLYGEGTNKAVLGPREMEVTEDWLIVRTPYSESKSRYEIVEKVVRTDSYTFVYMSAVSAHPIPRAALGERDYEEFVQALEQRVAKASGH
jgi:hypothetical protein